MQHMVSASRLRLNPTKTEVMWLGSGQQINQVNVSDILIKRQGRCDSLSWRGTLASLSTVSCRCRHTRCCTLTVQILPLQIATSTLSVTTRQKQQVQAFISWRLDYCNSLLYGVTDKLMRQVHSVHNAAVRLIIGAKRRERITPILRQLHWLPIRQRVEFKIASLVYQVLSSKVPTYLADDIHLASESSDRSLRSSSGRKCSVTRVYRCFAAAGPRTGTTYLPVCETRKSAAQNSEDNWKHSCLRRTLLLTYLINGVPKYSRSVLYSVCRIKEIVFHVHSLEGTTTSLITNADHWTWL